MMNPRMSPKNDTEDVSHDRPAEAPMARAVSEQMPDLEEIFAFQQATRVTEQPKLPTGSMPLLDRHTCGLQGLTLLHGDFERGCATLGVQIGLDVVAHNPAAILVVFGDHANRGVIVSLLATRVTDATARHRLAEKVFVFDACSSCEYSEAEWAPVVDEAKQKANASRAFVLLEEGYPGGQRRRRRTFTHMLGEKYLVQRIWHKQRASGDVWMLLFEHDVLGPFDRVLSYSPTVDRASGRLASAEVTIRDGDARHVQARLRLTQDPGPIGFEEAGLDS